MRSPSSMASRLWRGCVVFALLIVGSAALIYSGVRYQDAAVRNEVQNIHPLEITSLEVRADFADSQASLGAYLLTRQPQLLGFYSVSRRQLKAALDQLRARAAAGLQPDVIAQQRQLATWLTFADRVQALPPGDPALARVAAESYPSAIAFDAANGRMLTQLRVESRPGSATRSTSCPAPRRGAGSSPCSPCCSPCWPRSAPYAASPGRCAA